MCPALCHPVAPLSSSALPKLPRLVGTTPAWGHSLETPLEAQLYFPLVHPLASWLFLGGGSRELSGSPGKFGCQPFGWHSPGCGGKDRALLLPRVSANVSWEQAFLVGFKRSYEIASISEPLSSNSKAFKYSRK